MEWTRETPTRKGYYWNWADWADAPVIEEITLWEGIPHVDNGSEHWEASDDAYKGWWYGPINPPALPAREKPEYTEEQWITDLENRSMG